MLLPHIDMLPNSTVLSSVISRLPLFARSSTRDKLTLCFIILYNADVLSTSSDLKLYVRYKMMYLKFEQIHKNLIFLNISVVILIILMLTVVEELFKYFSAVGTTIVYKPQS